MARRARSAGQRGSPGRRAISCPTPPLVSTQSDYANPEVNHSPRVHFRRREVLVAFAVASTARAIWAQPASPPIPRAWNDQAITTLEVPSPEPRHTPVHVASDYYYRIPVRQIYRTYPRYRPGKEPPGYVEWLK